MATRWMVGLGFAMAACASGDGGEGGGGEPDAWVEAPAVDAAGPGDPDAAPQVDPADAAVPPAEADAAPPPAPDAAPPDTTGAIYAHGPYDLFRVDPVTLAATAVGPFLWPATIAIDYMTDLAVDQDGGIIGISFTRIYRVDPATGVCTYLADLAGNFNGLSFVPAGVIDVGEVLVATSIEGALVRLDPMTGATTTIGSYGGGLTSSGDTVSVQGFGTIATVVPPGATTDSLALIDPATGAATVIGDTGFTGIWGLGFWDGAAYGFTASNQLVRIDTITGAAELVATGDVQWWGAGVTTLAPAGTP